MTCMCWFYFFSQIMRFCWYLRFYWVNESWLMVKKGRLLIKYYYYIYALSNKSYLFDLWNMNTYRINNSFKRHDATRYMFVKCHGSLGREIRMPSPVCPHFIMLWVVIWRSNTKIIWYNWLWSLIQRLGDWKLKMKKLKNWKLHYINPKGNFTLSPQEQRQGTSVSSLIQRTISRKW